jgi:hypothetical protein
MPWYIRAEISAECKSNCINAILKVPKRENFSLAFFALSEPTWVCDLGPGEKNQIFYKMTPDFEGLWFFAAY